MTLKANKTLKDSQVSAYYTSIEWGTKESFLCFNIRYLKPCNRLQSIPEWYLNVKTRLSLLLKQNTINRTKRFLYAVVSLIALTQPTNSSQWTINKVQLLNVPQHGVTCWAMGPEKIDPILIFKAGRES